MTAAEAIAFLPEGHWLRNVILRGERLRALVPAELRQTFLKEGFEL